LQHPKTENFTSQQLHNYQANPLPAMPLSAKQMEYLALAVSSRLITSYISELETSQLTTLERQWQCFDSEPKVQPTHSDILTYFTKAQ
jgi:hypothetical protein